MWWKRKTKPGRVFTTIDFVLPTNSFDEPRYLLLIHGCFTVHSWLYGYSFTIFKILIFTFSCYFFVSQTPILVMVPGDCCFYIYYVNVPFYIEKRSCLYSHEESKHTCFIQFLVICFEIDLKNKKISKIGAQLVSKYKLTIFKFWKP